MTRSTSRSKRRRNIVGTAASWINMFPELMTRPQLIQEMQTNRSLRMLMFWTHNALGNASVIRDSKVAGFLVHKIIDEAQRRLEVFRPALEERDFRVVNEAGGVLKDLRRNFVYRTSGHCMELPTSHQYAVSICSD
jgi:hypothetical protein